MFNFQNYTSYTILNFMLLKFLIIMFCKQFYNLNNSICLFSYINLPAPLPFPIPLISTAHCPLLPPLNGCSFNPLVSPSFNAFIAFSYPFLASGLNFLAFLFTDSGIFIFSFSSSISLSTVSFLIFFYCCSFLPYGQQGL